MRRSRLYLLLSLALIGCNGDDAGDIAFIKRAIPTVLGRSERGSAEIRALKQVLDDHDGDRQVIIDVLVQQPEYVEYWTLVLADVLRVRRDSSGLEQPEECWSEPLITDDLYQAELLAQHIAANPATADYGSEWNMTDALRAAVYMDDLSVAYAAYLPTIAGTVESESQEQDAAEQFDKVYLGRSPACLSCHSSTYSVVDAWSGWDRHATAPWALEASVFSGPGGAPDFNGDAAFEATFTAGKATYDTYCGTCHDDASSGQRGDAVLTLDPDHDGETAEAEGDFTLANRVPVLSADQIHAQISLGSEDGGMGAYGESVSDGPDSDLIVYLQSRFGSMDDVRQYFRVVTTDGAGLSPWGMAGTCDAEIERGVDLAAGSRPAAFAGRERYAPDAIELVNRLQDGLADLPTSLASAPAPVTPVALDTLDGQTAFAYMVASTLADALILNATGSAPVVAHGMARNDDQQALREALIDAMVTTETPAGRTRLSLQDALYELVDYNLNAPADSETDDPYFIDMFFDPWVATDPRDPSSAAAEGPDANSVGDLVHRPSAPTLLWSAAHTLGWERPLIFPGSTFPSATLSTNLGAFRSEEKPGFGAWDMQSLLYWEEAVGGCASPAASVGLDWIDDLRAAAEVSAQPLTVLDLVISVHDRILGTPEVGQDQIDAIEDVVFGVGSNKTLAGVSLSGLSASKWNALEKQLRGYCGALMVSPQYALRGIPTFTSLPDDGAVDSDPLTLDWSDPKLVVCWQGGGSGVAELCTYEELYDAYSLVAGP